MKKEKPKQMQMNCEIRWLKIGIPVFFFIFVRLKSNHFPHFLKNTITFEPSGKKLKIFIAK